MKRLFIFILSVIFLLNSGIVYAAETSAGTVWGDSTDVFNQGFENQKPVTDSKLQKAIQAIKDNSASRKQKKLRNEVKPLSPSSDFNHLQEFANSQSPDDELSQTHTVMIPMQAYNYEGIQIPPGYYKLSCKKIAKDEYILELSQGNKIFVTVKARQTVQDLEQDSIDFCNAEIISDNRIRLMYGSIDLNLVGYLYFEPD